jgi:4-amino-4-deoxy-L-arabinose transferase-like glycosyltransferase
MAPRRGLLLLLVILVVALALRIHWYIGPFTVDCFGNAQFAYQVATGAFDITKEYYAANRIAFLFPIGLAVRALGFRPFAYSLVGLLCSLGCIVLAYALGTRVYDRKAGLVAAAILAVMPLEIYCWSPLLVDSVTPFYWGASLGLFFLGLVEDPPARHRQVLLFVSGAVLGLASYTREHAPIVFLVMALILALRRARPPRRVLWVLAGFAAVALLGEGYYFVATGVPLLRVRRLWEHFGPGTGAAEPGALEIGHVQGLRPYFLQSMITEPDYFGCLFWLAWVAAVVLLLRRKKEDLFPLAWFLGLYVAMDFVLRTVVRLLAYPPYINVLDLPAALLTARWLAPRLSGRPLVARPWLVALGAVLALGGAAVLLFHHGLDTTVDAWGSGLGGWGRAHAHDLRFATVPIFLGSALLALGLLLSLRRFRLDWGGAALVFLVVSSLFLTGPGVRWRKAEARPLREMARIVATDGRPVYMTSLWSATGLTFFLGYHTDFRRYWNRWERATPRDGRGIEFRELPDSTKSLAESSYVVLDKAPVRRLEAGRPAAQDVLRLPAYLRTPPGDWRLLFDSPDYSLYRVTP